MVLIKINWAKNLIIKFMSKTTYKETLFQNNILIKVRTVDNRKSLLDFKTQDKKALSTTLNWLQASKNWIIVLSLIIQE